MKNRSPIWRAAVGLAIAAAAADAAPRLGPPSRFMVEDRHRSAVVEVIELLGDGRFRARTLVRVFGETPDELVLRGAGQEPLELGRTYLVGHTDKPARRTPRWETDPAGPRVLSVPAVGPAIFDDSSAMRGLVGGSPESDPLAGRRRLDAVLEQLARPDVQSRRFVTAELALDPGLREMVGEDDLARIRRVFESGGLEPLAHDYLLRAALPMIDRWGGDWLAAGGRRVVAGHRPELELTSFVPGLLATALRTLQATGVRADGELARPHVASNNPGVGKAAYSALMALDPELGGELTPGFLASRDLHPDTRRFIARAAATSSPRSDRR